MGRSIISIGGYPVLHPDVALQNARQHNTPVDFWQRANSYTCPRGPEPGVAWLLLTRASLDKLDPSAFHSLKFQDDAKSTNLAVSSLVLVRSYTLNHALAGDRKAARLVEFRDRRHLLRMSSINKQYNVRQPSPSATSGSLLYYDESLNGGTGLNLATISGSNLATLASQNLGTYTGIPWTWQAMLDDIWGQLPSATTAPTLPYSPDGTPEGFRFVGENTWDALHVVLDKAGMTTAYNPILDTVSYVEKFSTQAGLSASISSNKYSGRLMYDYDPDGTPEYILGKFPETVRVFFPRQEEYHGIEQDTPHTDNWEMSPVESKDYATGLSGAHSGSVVTVWDDLPALYDSAGTNSNSAALQTRANELGANVANTLMFNRSRRMYAGVLTDVLPGNEITELRWRDYGDARGLVTELIQRSDLDEYLKGIDLGSVNEHLKPPDLSRHTHPLWPRLGQPVQVDDGSSSIGTALTANPSGLFPGFVRRWAAGAWSSLDTCWIRPVDLEAGETPTEATVVDLRQLDSFNGRLSGSETVSGDTRPVYLVRSGGQDGQHTIEGFSAGADGSEILYEFETLQIFGDRDESDVVGNIIDVSISKAADVVKVRLDATGGLVTVTDVSAGSEVLNLGDTLNFRGTTNPTVTKVANEVRVTIDGGGGASTWDLRDDTGPTTTTISDTEIVQFTSTIDETQNGVWMEWNLTPGVPNVMEASFGLMLVVEGYSAGADGSENVYPTEKIVIRGDRDQSAVVGNIIDVSISKAADTITVDIDATGTLFTLTDDQLSPSSADIDLGDDLDISTSIDESQVTLWAQWKVTNIGSDPAADLVFGKVFDVEDDASPTPGSVDIFPLEKLLFASGAGVTTAVSKATDTVTVTISAGAGSMTFNIEDEQSSPQTITISDTETIKLDTLIDKVGLPSTFSEFRVAAGAPEQLSLAFGALIQISGYSGGDGSETLYVTETLKFQGDRDQSATLGNIIDIQISDAGSTVVVDIDATGDLFQIDPDTGSQVVALGEVIDWTTTIDETMTTAFHQLRATGSNMIHAFGKVFDVTGDTGSVDIFPLETLNIVGGSGTTVAVTKAVNTVTATVNAGALPIGAVIMGTKAPILSGGKYYIDDGAGAADTDWALMDGASNITPGTGIEMWDRLGGGSDPYFVRAKDSLAAANNTAAGRTVAATPDDDEVTLEVHDPTTGTVSHGDHYHRVDADVCDGCHDGAQADEFQFTTADRLTGKQVSIAGGVVDLDHEMSMTNHQGSGSDKIEMTPPHKKLHFFERVA